MLLWVRVLTPAGTVVPGFSPAARQRGLIWRQEASLGRRLAAVQSRREFGAFFRYPSTSGLMRREVRIVSVTVISGWVIGVFQSAFASKATSQT